MRGGQHDVGLVVADVLGRHVHRGDERHGVPVVHDREVDDAVGHHAHCVDRVDARDGGGDRSVVTAELSEQRAHEAARRSGERRDAQRRGSSHVARRQSLEPFEAGKQLAALARQGPAVVGEQHAATTSFEQYGVEVAFELLHLLRDGGRGVAEPIGGGHDRAVAVDCNERAEALKVDHEEIVRFHVKDSELVLHRVRCNA